MNVEKIAITSREQWLALRAQDITASDVPAVCGEGLYGSAAKVWAEKRGLIPPQELTEAMKRGLWGEAAVFEAISWEYPTWEVRRAKVYLRDIDAGLGATPDGVAVVPGREGIVVVQCKVIAAPVFKADWLANPDDPVDVGHATPPLAYQLQTLTESMLAEASCGALAVLVVDTFKWVLRIFWIERHSGAEASIRERVAAFRVENLAKGIQPRIDPALDDELVKSLFPRDNGAEIDLSGDNELPGLADQLVAARAEKKVAEENVSAFATAIKAKLGAASFARIADGRRISCKSQSRGAYQVAATEFRVLKVLNK